MEGIILIFWLIPIFLIIYTLDFMRKTIRQREEQIAQMDHFIELYKAVNGLNPANNEERTSQI